MNWRDKYPDEHPPVSASACNCIGPQKGQPVCPCQMRNVEIRDGRYVRKPEDLGPAPPPPMVKMPREEPGMHRVSFPVACKDPAHYGPTMLLVPAGMKHVHYCPSCDYKTVIFGRDVTC